MKYIKKGLISKSHINRKIGLNYEGNIEFRVGDKKYECLNLNQFIKNIIVGNNIKYEIFLDKFYGVDFKVYSKNTSPEGYINFHVQIIDNYINKDKITHLLKGIRIK